MRRTSTWSSSTGAPTPVRGLAAYYVRSEWRDGRRRREVGETVMRYRLRAEVPGTYTVLPARVYGMYSPDIGSSTASAVVVVVE